MLQALQRGAELAPCDGGVGRISPHSQMAAERVRGGSPRQRPECSGRDDRANQRAALKLRGAGLAGPWTAERARAVDLPSPLQLSSPLQAYLVDNMLHGSHPLAAPESQGRLRGVVAKCCYLDQRRSAGRPSTRMKGSGSSSHRDRGQPARYTSFTRNPESLSDTARASLT